MDRVPAEDCAADELPCAPDAAAVLAPEVEDPDPPEPELVDPAELDPVTAVAVLAPPVPVVHWVGPCLSHAGGMGAVVASKFAPLDENVGLSQLEIEMFWTTAPGIFVIWAKLA